MTNTDVRLLTLEDVEAAAQILAHAFKDDPLTLFMLPVKATRKSSLLKFFRAHAEVNIKNQRGYGVGEPLQGVAYWKAPEQELLSLRVQFSKPFLSLLFSMYPIGHFRVKRIGNEMSILHEKYAAGPHFFLDYVGVLESARGQGLASRLIRPFLAKADSQKVITYTDTVASSNVPLYEHLGFQCVEVRPVERTGITIYALSRDAHEGLSTRG